MKNFTEHLVETCADCGAVIVWGDCWACEGTGRIDPGPNEVDPLSDICQVCNGKGEVAICPNCDGALST